MSHAIQKAKVAWYNGRVYASMVIIKQASYKS